MGESSVALVRRASTWQSCREAAKINSRLWRLPVPVRFFYVDESYDREKFCLSAIGVRHSHWKEAFDSIKAFRQQLKETHGIPLRTELHATEFVSGHGQVSDSIVTKWERSRIFLGALELVSRLPETMLFNVCLPQKGIADSQMRAWDRLINRVERTMREMDETELPLRDRLAMAVGNSITSDEVPTGISRVAAEQIEARLKVYRARAFFIADEGREKEITTAIRRMHVFNPIPSHYGEWASGSRTQNIPAVRIIEDPVFKRSDRSYFLQLADFVAFALLKREVAPTPFVRKYMIHQMFDDVLAGKCFRAASPRDPLGIVRG